VVNVGIVIRKNATENTLTTAEGKIFDLSNKKESNLTTALVIDFLEKRGFFPVKKIA
jgi:hypothetical protein